LRFLFRREDAFSHQKNLFAVSGVYIDKDQEMLWQEANPEEAQLARSLQRMWPHREHESGLLRGLMCWLGLHLWLQPDYTAFVRRNSVRFCLWCSSVEINGRVYR
jgi:hypothetical protein